MSNTNEKPTPALGPDTMAAIGRELRPIHASIIAEGVPDRFAEILHKLDKPSEPRAPIDYRYAQIPLGRDLGIFAADVRTPRATACGATRRVEAVREDVHTSQ